MVIWEVTHNLPTHMEFTTHTYTDTHTLNKTGVINSPSTHHWYTQETQHSRRVSHTLYQSRCVYIEWSVWLTLCAVKKQKDTPSQLLFILQKITLFPSSSTVKDYDTIIKTIQINFIALLRSSNICKAHINHLPLYSYKHLVLVFSPAPAAACLTCKAKGSVCKVLFKRRCTRQLFWQSGVLPKVKNVQLTRKATKKGQLLIAQPTNHNEENTGFPQERQK